MQPPAPPAGSAAGAAKPSGGRFVHSQLLEALCLGPACHALLLTCVRVSCVQRRPDVARCHDPRPAAQSVCLLLARVFCRSACSLCVCFWARPRSWLAIWLRSARTPTLPNPPVGRLCVAHSFTDFLQSPGLGGVAAPQLVRAPSSGPAPGKRCCPLTSSGCVCLNVSLIASFRDACTGSSPSSGSAPPSLTLQRAPSSYHSSNTVRLCSPT